MRFQEPHERGATDFFLSLKNELDIMAQEVVLYEIFKGFYLRERLSFVIISSACPNVSVANLGFKGIGVPKFERFGRHHVIVSIHQHSRCRRVYDFLTINKRISLGRNHFHVVCTSFGEQFLPTHSTTLYVAFALGMRTDARNADEREKFFEKSRFIGGDIFLYRSHKREYLGYDGLFLGKRCPSQGQFIGGDETSREVKLIMHLHLCMLLRHFLM